LKGLVSLQSIERRQMKTRKTITQGIALLSALLFSAAAVSNSNGQVIVEDDLFSAGGPVSNASISILRDPTEIDVGDNTGLVFGIEPPTFSSPTSANFTVTGLGVSLDASGGDWFIAQAGQIFSPDSIASGQFDSLNSSFSFDVPPGQFFQETDLTELFASQTLNALQATQFYIGVATTSSDDVPDGVFVGSPDFPPRDIFGWALIEVGASFFDDSFRSIELLDSAVAFDAGNIIIGQNAFAIPEPSSGIVLATLLGLGVARRRKR